MPAGAARLLQQLTMTLHNLPPIAETAHDALLRFNRQVLDQALALIALHEDSQAPAYLGPVGVHLRHVIEHYEALLSGAERNAVDYDRRPRDSLLERCPVEARRRVIKLQTQLAPSHLLPLAHPIGVRGQSGPVGELNFTVDSTFGRELVFVASHAVHHFALLQPHCRQHGIDLGADFGKAPATVAHERGGSIAPASTLHRKDTPCIPTPLAA